MKPNIQKKEKIMEIFSTYLEVINFSHYFVAEIRKVTKNLYLVILICLAVENQNIKIGVLQTFHI